MSETSERARTLLSEHVVLLVLWEYGEARRGVPYIRATSTAWLSFYSSWYCLLLSSVFRFYHSLQYFSYVLLDRAFRRVLGLRVCLAVCMCAQVELTSFTFNLFILCNPGETKYALKIWWFLFDLMIMMIASISQDWRISYRFNKYDVLIESLLLRTWILPSLSAGTTVFQKDSLWIRF